MFTRGYYGYKPGILTLLGYGAPLISCSLQVLLLDMPLENEKPLGNHHVSPLISPSYPYSYGPLPLVSTYNPIYRVYKYNPIYNQL
jgi:hypothetical protein